MRRVLPWALVLGCDPTGTTAASPASWAFIVDVERPTFQRTATDGPTNDRVSMESRARVVTLDACEAFSQGAVEWLVRTRVGNNQVSEPIVAVAPGGGALGEDCRVLWQAPYEGAFQVEARQGNGVGGANVDVRDIWLVSMGDSFSSGEGNPDDWGVTFTTWQDEQCHRSGFGWPARLAERIQDRHPDAQVLLTYLPCSGAKITSGMLGPYGGAESGPQLDPQLDVARGLVIEASEPLGEWLPMDRQPDAVLMTGGGNDIGFAGIVEDSLKFGPSTELRGAMDGKIRDLSEVLGWLYVALETQDLQPRSPDGEVRSDRTYVLEYADPTRGDDGTFDACWTDNSFFMSHVDMELLYREVVARVNETVRLEASFAGATAVPIEDLFSTHGVCGDPPWFRFPAESFVIQGNKDGTYHPTTAGHAAMAERADAYVIIDDNADHVHTPRFDVQVLANGHTWDPVVNGQVRQGPLEVVVLPNDPRVVVELHTESGILGQGQGILDEIGDVTLTVRRWWQPRGPNADRLPLPDKTVELTLLPSRNELLAPLSVRLETKGGTFVPLSPIDPLAPHLSYVGETWLGSVRALFSHADPDVTISVDHTRNPGSGDVTTSYDGRWLDPVGPVRQHLDVIVYGDDLEATARVDLTLADIEDWRSEVLDELVVWDVTSSLYGTFNSARYTGAANAPVEVQTDGPWQSYRFDPVAGAPWAATGFALRVDGKLRAVSSLVSTSAQQVELIACFNRLADCDALVLHPEGSAVVATYAMPPTL
ncbi:MAG: SGNH/GDSL hydrolase family protein [Myxococcota bacterium]